VSLTPSELAVLDRLLATPGQVVAKDELLAAIGGSARTANAVEVHVSSLRRKLEYAGPPVVHTVHGQGYVLRPVPTFDAANRADLLEMRERLVRQREQAMARRDQIVADMESRFARPPASPIPD
jgi:DNA-binding winged helix-turn-helix (wHTH) protein